MATAQTSPGRSAAGVAALQPNNFDLLRLFAACEVVLGHMISHAFALTFPFWARIVSQAPGVPIFFFISGFLISASWERHPDLRGYVRNRFLRIYPAYALVVVLSLAAILLLAHVAHHGTGLLAWLGLQLALVPQWNPGFLRSYGNGVVNGSLWTIPVEVSFYVVTPILYRLARGGARRLDAILVALVVLSATSMLVMSAVGRDMDVNWAKAVRLTPVPWFWMYACGWLAQRHLDRLLPLVQGKLLLLFVLNLIAMAACARWNMAPFLFSGSRFISPVNFALLALLLLAAAFTGRDLANRLLRRNDLSYGIYLFHMPIANVLLANGFTGLAGALITALLTLPAAAVSWFALEKPLLAHRSAPLYRHDAPQPTMDDR